MTTLATTIDAQKHSFEWEIKIFPFKKFIANAVEKLLRRYVRQLGEQLDETCVEMESVLVIVKGYSKQEAQHDLPAVRNAMEVFFEFEARLFKADYFGSKEVEAKSHLLISRFYDVELELKKRAFAGEKITPTPIDLADAIVEKSKKALAEALSKLKK